MRDVSAKINTLRTATAQATLKLSPETLNKIRENKIPKGNPLEVAKIAAIQAAKNTSLLIPYCHQVPLDFVGIEFELAEETIKVTATAKTIYHTGVEMEALTAASTAALTLYDMMKMLDEAMEIQNIVLLEKEGGKSDFKEAFANRLRAAVLVISDSVSAGKKSDRSGKLIVERLQEEGLEIVDYKIVSDDIESIREAVLRYCDELSLDIVITTGGTGISPRDNTPEAMETIFERELPGIAEASRAYGQERTPYAMLSRAKAGVRSRTLILNLPGSTGGVTDAINALFPAVLHSFKMLWGGGHEKKRTQEVLS